VLYDFDSANPDELSITAGEYITITNQVSLYVTDLNE